MPDGHLSEETTTRAGFVKRLGKLAAVGLGVALVPATNALGASIACCRSADCDAQCQLCCPGTRGYRCPANPCGGCCVCQGSSIPNCVWTPLCPC
jgi:hypothetical protein